MDIRNAIRCCPVEDICSVLRDIAGGHGPESLDPADLEDRYGGGGMDLRGVRLALEYLYVNPGFVCADRDAARALAVIEEAT